MMTNASHFLFRDQQPATDDLETDHGNHANRRSTTGRPGIVHHNRHLLMLSTRSQEYPWSRITSSEFDGNCAMSTNQQYLARFDNDLKTASF